MERIELNRAQEKRLFKLLTEMIAIPSSVHDGAGIYEFVFDYLGKNGLAPFYQSISNPYATYSDFKNIYVRLGSGAGPKIMLNGHLDTVVPYGNWVSDPYKCEIEGDRVYGVGAADMKGGCAAAIMAAIELHRRVKDLNGELFLSFMFGEEAPFSLGADTLLREYGLVDYDLVIVTEPSPILAVNDYCYTHKRYHRSNFPVAIVGAEGRVLFEIELFGKPAHASHPSQGINALEDASVLISQLKQFQLFESVLMGRGHYCVLNIEGGDQTFTVPSYCKVFVNRQLTVGETEKAVTNELKRIIKKCGLRSKVQIKRRFTPAKELEYEPYLFESGEYLDRFIEMLPRQGRKRPCRFTTSSVGDFNLFGVRTGVPTLVFGPGGGNIHSPNEYVNGSEVVETANYLLNFFLEVF